MLVGCCSVYLFACLRELVFWLVIGDSRCVVCFCMGLIFGCLWWMVVVLLIVLVRGASLLRLFVF